MSTCGVQAWRWILFVCFHWLCVCQETPRPLYMVTIPAVIQAGSETRLCATLLQPNETLVMTVSLGAGGEKNVLFQETSDQEFYRCFQFQAPAVQKESVQSFKVEVRGDTFLSTEERKVKIKPSSPMTFVQTDKPLYLPGQTVHFRVITLDDGFRPVNQQYDIVELEDTNRNRIGQWVNTTSNGKILQLSHSLTAEAPQGTYYVIVSIDDNKIHKRFKVEEYVLPKYDIKLEAAGEISIDQEEFRVKVCATYTYGQPVPGTAELGLCRPTAYHYMVPMRFDPDTKQGVPEFTPPCHTATVEITGPWNGFGQDLNYTEPPWGHMLDKSGCGAYVFKMAIFKNIDQKVLRDSLNLNARVEEEGTGISRSQEKRISLSFEIGKLSFVETPNIYTHGSIVEGKVKVVHYDNTPIPDKLVYLLEGERWSARLLQNLTTDSEGIASFSVNTTDMAKEDLILTISDTRESDSYSYRSPYFVKGQQTISLIQPAAPHSKTVSYLEIQKRDHSLPCEGEEPIDIEYTIVGETVAMGSVDLFFLVLSRGAIVHQGLMKVDVLDSPVTSGEITVRLAVSPDMSPVVQVLVYVILPSETVIADSRDFPMEKCFKHKVQVQFSPSRAVPGEQNTLQVTSLPGSLCGLSAVDQSVLIKEPGQELDVDKIFDLLPVTKASRIPYDLEDPFECLRVRPRRSSPPRIRPRPGRGDKKEAYEVFQNMGLKMATNLVTRTPSCLLYKGKEYHHGLHVAYRNEERLYSVNTMRLSSSPLGGASGPGEPPPIQTVRTFFPETWIWELVEVGESGSADVPLTVPDTITTWQTEAFCLSPEGFGLAPPTELTVFQPFFLELTLPFSIIRGEHFELKATVFNYLPKCIMVSVTPAPSLDYTLTPVSGLQYSSCLCASGRKTFSWTLAASALGVLNVTVSAEAVVSHVACDNEIVSVPDRGRIDVVTRPLVVKAEGTEQTNTYSWLMCPTDGEALTEEVELQLPKVVIDGSARASVSVLGDILGRALQNLDGMLQMPYGCGEQNMALLAPNIYILEYLRDTQQLTAAIKDKATRFLTGGYQRQLNYKHHDGAFSTFGQGSGNTWLTAFVFRCLGRARSFIYVDPATTKESRVWLEKQQKPDGCFQSMGKLFNNRMKGGVTDDVTLTAYITASMLELNTSVSDPVVNNSLSCLRGSVSDLSNTYTTALLAYTFTLAGDMETRDLLLQHLNKKASTEGGLLHWSQTSSSSSSSSLAVEISSYVLLAALSSSTQTSADLGYASRIVRWLIRQQNSRGGFSSTQDTVVALQALALYSTLVFSPEGASTVTVTPPSGEEQLFDVNSRNKLLYQERALQDVSGRYSLEVKGSACASVQVAVHYNIPTPSDSTTLSIQVTPEAGCHSNSLRPRLTLKLQSLYAGKEETTNMVIVDVKMLSGFSPDPDSLANLKKALLVDRVETKDDHVLIYLRELSSILFLRKLSNIAQRPLTLNHSLDIVQDLPVQNLKPAVVKIYDYYQPSDQAETEYIYPCAADQE